MARAFWSLTVASFALMWIARAGVVLADVGCTMRKHSTCICDMSDGSGVVNLSLISNNQGKPYFRKIQGDNTHFSFNPCHSFTDNKCKGDVAVCQEEKGGINCGKQSTGAFDVVSVSNPVTLTLTYTGGDPATADGKIKRSSKERLSIITLICQHGSRDDISFTKENPQYTYNFLLKTKHACPQPSPPNPTTSPATAPVTSSSRHKPEEHDISTGTIIDIVLLLVVIIYFAGGVIYLRVRHQATGAELIPNRTFWISLPSLIKSGIFFLIDGCRRLRGKPSYT